MSARFHAGFTGTRRGMSDDQKMVLEKLLKKAYRGKSFPHFHHGDCIGADAEACEIAERIGYGLVCHPPTAVTYRAMVASHIEHPSRPYLDRDRDIVNACTTLFVTPLQKKHVIRSGTWTTYRYGQRVGRHTFLIYPDGLVEESNG